MGYSKVYDEFKETYKDVDLSYVDNGQLLPQLTKLNAEAERLMHDAKMIESDIYDDETMYAAYEAAFNRYADRYNRIMGALDATEAIKLKAHEDKERQKRSIEQTGQSVSLGLSWKLPGSLSAFLYEKLSTGHPRRFRTDQRGAEMASSFLPLFISEGYSDTGTEIRRYRLTRAHHVEAAGELLCKNDMIPLYLPPYSPDLNPIEVM